MKLTIFWSIIFRNFLYGACNSPHPRPRLNTPQSPRVARHAAAVERNYRKWDVKAASSTSCRNLSSRPEEKDRRGDRRPWCWRCHDIRTVEHPTAIKYHTDRQLFNDAVKNWSITTKHLYLILTFRSHHEIFIRRSWYSVLPSLDATISCRLTMASFPGQPG